ncbi:ParB N-terminal domain-containing protein [Veillonella montpellierensis]|uniref:ParB N-terminal domain-containing protein n=1 Tax=Veillonella montpellierensis TaxID=187328 RepID=UPI0023F763FC|nr:ParB N-terminal domain-containing protein [Veillonella montpellierensis]
MKVVQISTDALIPYDNNPRNNTEAVAYVANSIKEFGFKVPIVVDSNNIVICGHTRLLAAKQLNMKEVPCIIADDLTDEQIKAFRLADNKVGEIATWYDELLEMELGNIVDIDMSDFGFIDDVEEEIKKDVEEKAEVEFTEVLGEEHNYIVLYFDNEIDWINAQSLFELPRVKMLPTNKDGIEKEKMTTYGVGRVVNGARAIQALVNSLKEVK